MIIEILMVFLVIFFMMSMMIYLMSRRRWKIYVEDPHDKDINSQVLQHVKFRFTEKESCDFILSHKFRWGVYEGREHHQKVLDDYGKETKPVFIFWVTDSNDVFYPPSNVFFYRTSISKSTRQPNEDVLAFVWETVPYFRHMDADRPVVGFCGANWDNRKRMIRLLEEHPAVDTNFIIRDRFWGGKENDEKLRHQFHENLLDSHFTICNRGSGNFTMRFFQALSCGRTPILIDTDMIFPFETEDISWDEYIIRGDTEEQVIEKMLFFFDKTDMKKQQRKTRDMFRRYFHPRVYFHALFSLHMK